jgi:hypothetical protein
LFVDRDRVATFGECMFGTREKRMLLETSVFFSAACAIGLGCSADAPIDAASAGASGKGGGGSRGIAGSDPAGGAAGTGGAAGIAGSVSGAGGADDAGGTDAAGGARNEGGARSCMTLDCIGGTTNEFGFAWRDSFFLTPCYDPSGPLCNTIASSHPQTDPVEGCPNMDAPDFEDRGFAFKEMFSLGGEAGKTYAATIVVNGITEAKVYTGGKRDAGETKPANPNDPKGVDTFYVGGMAKPSHYNVVRMRILAPDKATEVGRYYLNSFPDNQGWEEQQTFAIGYTKTIDVPGGGFVEYLTQDSNCQDINNCGPGPFGSSCAAPRNVPNEPDLQLPTSFAGHPTGDLNVVTHAAQPWHSQIVHVRVTSVVAK